MVVKNANSRDHPATRIRTSGHRALGAVLYILGAHDNLSAASAEKVPEASHGSTLPLE